MQERVNRRPDRRLLLAEGPRLISEIGSLLPAAPFLSMAPRGDGHRVLVLPGFGASDGSTVVLRTFLDALGYSTHRWQLGTNRGPAMEQLLPRLSARLEQLSGADQGKVSLLGWSLGGVYARVLAHHHPDRVRQVVTLGSPFAVNGPRVARSASAGNDTAFGNQPTSRVRMLAGEPLPGVPSTAVFSKTDSIVPWQIATQPVTGIAENIEVYASHIGLGFNPSVLYAVADRLANREGDWTPFRRQGWQQFLFGPADLTPDDPRQWRRRRAGARPAP